MDQSLRVALQGANIKLSLQNNLATGAVNLAGNVTVNQLETFAGVYAVNLTGSNNVISGSLTTFLNTGGITFGDSTSDVSTFTNGLTAIASAVNLAGIVATTNSAMNLGAVNLSLNGTVKSGSELSLSPVFLAQLTNYLSRITLRILEVWLLLMVLSTSIRLKLLHRTMQ